MKTVGFLNPAHLKYVGVYDQYRGTIWVAKLGFTSLSMFIRIEESLQMTVLVLYSPFMYMHMRPSMEF